MGTTRENYQGEKTHEYEYRGYFITRMGNGDWYVFAGPNGTGKDMRLDAKTLKGARKLIDGLHDT